MTKSFTKTVAAALTVALISGSFVSGASASDRGFEVKPVKQHSRKTAVAAGALLGLTGALIGAAIVSNQARAAESRRRGYEDRDPREAGYGHQRPVRFVEAEEDCFEKPIKRFDRYSGETVIVGYKTICR
ncbi:MAG: hypothetical protein Q8S58_04930 [Bosea sp. (in: a-proteobacteria)]|uniref:hypothetical protein n=1 Tax=Bosea sp. (in: a-proteobacteria) TaxID=1871050 RepID=UPI002733CFB3|nr:hypothetical protein [Bosea sp. (in: a-proteobacteria)]MDP3254480.1 hypothetical protein [Bosea sp. (in: a-proteobacteria)]MDP3318452.1 hypothetical protein [Bosea sp. (in: a-proteobacteria)]